MVEHAATVLQVDTVAIIGAGASGIAAAKYLLAQGSFSLITIFEQRSRLGGIWNTDAQTPNDAANFPSSIYDGLESNIPSVIMQYSDFPFPEDCPLLPNASSVQAYLALYGSEIEHLVQFRHQVMDVKKVTEHVGGVDRDQWSLDVLDLDTGRRFKQSCGGVIVANGRYNDPYIPQIPGLSSWQEMYSESVLHSKYFRSAADFKEKKVLIVGFSSSGVDIAAQVEPVCAKPLLISQKSQHGLSPGSSAFADGKEILPSIRHLDAEDGSVVFVDGRTERDIDNIIFCTGYNYEYPFLTNLQDFRGPDPPGNTDTYLHIFYIPDPTLAFVLLPLRVVAFPFAQSQAAAIAAVWSGRLPLPTKDAMENWVTNNKRERGEGRSFHKLSSPGDGDYMNAMYEWYMQASPNVKSETFTDKRPPYWGPRERWLRKYLHDIRRATEEQGSQRFRITKIEDLGFKFTDS